MSEEVIVVKITVAQALKIYTSAALAEVSPKPNRSRAHLQATCRNNDCDTHITRISFDRYLPWNVSDRADVTTQIPPSSSGPLSFMNVFGSRN